MSKFKHQVMYNGKLVDVIDCTPTWEAIINIHINCLEGTGSDEAKEGARKEIMRMAQAADKWNAHVKTLQNGK